MWQSIYIAIIAMAVSKAWVTLLEPGGLFQNLGRYIRNKMDVDMDENGYVEKHTIWKALGGCEACTSFWIGVALALMVGLIAPHWSLLGSPFLSFWLTSKL